MGKINYAAAAPLCGVNEKIRKAKQDRDKRLNHSREYYQWLENSVYITTVDDSIWTAKDSAKAYRVRWQIVPPEAGSNHGKPVFIYRNFYMKAAATNTG